MNTGNNFGKIEVIILRIYSYFDKRDFAYSPISEIACAG